jgi:hypothetical protein
MCNVVAVVWLFVLVLTKLSFSVALFDSYTLHFSETNHYITSRQESIFTSSHISNSLKMLSTVPLTIIFMLHAVAVVTANIKLHLPSNPAHAKNHNARKICNIAIYCLNCRFSIRRGRYLLEVQDKNREFYPTAAFTNKDAVFNLIFEMLSDHFSVDIALKNLESEELIIGKNIHGGLKTVYRSEMLTETIDRYLKVIESEASISNFHFSYVHTHLSLLLSIFSCGCILNYIFTFWKGNRIVPHTWSS